MRAARLLAAERRAPTIAHIGAALDERLGDAARAHGAACPAYRWLGGLSHAAARQRDRPGAGAGPPERDGGRRQRRDRGGALGRAGAGEPHRRQCRPARRRLRRLLRGRRRRGAGGADASLRRRRRVRRAPGGAMRAARAAASGRRANGVRCGRWSSACCPRGRRRAETIGVRFRTHRHEPRSFRRVRPPGRRAAAPHELLPRRRLRLQDRARACSPRSCARASAASCPRS